MARIPLSSSLAGMCLPGGIRLGAAVAAGASGTVYRGWIGTGDDDEMLVAVKVSHADDERTAMRSMREAQAAARLDVPGVVKVASAGRLEDGRSWVAMEWIDGVTLEDALADAASWPVDRVLRVAAQLANALAAAHAAGIVHRDLKPANVMLRRGGDDERRGDQAVIVDFGIAKCAGDAATSASRCAGTPHYMAPEQALGDDCDAKADLYALGCVMVRMLTGRVPFDGTTVEVMLAHAGQPAPRVEGVPTVIADLVESLMAKRAEERPRDAAWVALRLERMVPVIGRGRGRGRGRSSTSTSTSTSTLTRPSTLTTTTTTTTTIASPTSQHPTRRGWLAGVFVAAIIIAVSAFAAAKSMGSTANPATAVEVLPPLVGPEPTTPGEPVAVVVDSGHSMRATIVGDPVAGGVLHMKLEIWNEDDEPIDARQLAATIRAPGGTTLALSIAGKDGVFDLRQAMTASGTHLVSVFAPSGETTFAVRVEVRPRPDV